MNEIPKTKHEPGIMRRISKRPILFFSWLTALLFLGTIGLSIVLDRVQRGPNWSDFAALTVIFGFAALFALSFLGFILSLVPHTRHYMTWMLCDFWFWLFSWQGIRRILVGTAILATLVALFYTEENWRGKRAWEKCKQKLEARGMVLDWERFIPPPVPDDQNFFKAPGIEAADWVGRGSHELSKRLSSAWQSHTNPMIVAELTVVPNNAEVVSNGDLIVTYTNPIQPHATARAYTSKGLETEPAVLPLITMENVPFASAIDQLERMANVRYPFDVKISTGQRGLNGESVFSPVVSFRWENVTALQAFLALLNNYNLVLQTNPITGAPQISLKTPGSESWVDSPVRDQINGFISNALEQSTNSSQGRKLQSSRGSIFFLESLHPIKPALLTVRADKVPNVAEMAQFFFRLPSLDVSGLRFESAGSNSFRILAQPSPLYPAADYLKGSDKFEADFDLIREALKRPYAWMDGDYSQPFAIPIPNFITMRNVAQILADRAKCYLLLGQPEKALRELTLLHDACRVLESRPTGKPMTLMAAMINVTVTRLYTDTVADGFHLQAWRETQLVELEKQLSEIHLLPFVFSAFEQEPAAVCHSLETMPISKLAAMMFFSPANPTLREKLKNPTYLLIRWMPRGWVYQNMANIAMRRKNNPGSFDLSNSIVLPRKVEIVGREIETSGLQRGPYSFMAAIAAPNYAKAVQRLAQNQTHAGQALLACALGRYRLAHGNYPESLDALTPQFIEKVPHDLIGGQPLHYRRTEAGKFLLYSIGWNEKDDGGVVALNKDGKEDQENGDWVWPVPTK